MDFPKNNITASGRTEECKNCIFAPGTGPYSRADHLIKIGNFCTPELLSDRSA